MRSIRRYQRSHERAMQNLRKFIEYSYTQTVVETDESGSEKDSGGSATFAVVANQVRLVGAFETVANGDGLEQVLATRSDAEASNRHHVGGTCMHHNFPR